MSSAAAPQISQSISLAFPTLIGQFQFNECQVVNEGLLKSLLKLEAEQPSSDHANMGGWHSKGDLLDQQASDVVQLRQWIADAINRMVHATGQLPEVSGRPAPRGNFRLTGWGNVSRIGNYHRVHSHPNSAWSGVYYLTGGQSELPLDGVLELYDPRQFAEMVDVPGSPYGQRIHITPIPGLMVIFPSWLYHFVHPVKTDSLRASIAFNAAWLPAK